VHRDAGAAGRPDRPDRSPSGTCIRLVRRGGAQPAAALASLLAGLHDEAGRVTLPRFYDAVLPLTTEERELFARLPFDEKTWLAEAGGSRAAYGEQGFTTWNDLGRPTGEINGMWGGHTGPARRRSSRAKRTRSFRSAGR